MLYKTEAIIIKKADFGEFDRLITAYTKNFGKLLLKAKSVRKQKAKLKGHLELFSYSHLMIASGKRLNIITGAETINGFFNLRQNMANLSAAYYFCELVDKLIAGPERDERIWQLLLTAFQTISRPAANFKTIKTQFEQNLLEYLGYDKNQNIESLLKEPIKSSQLLTKYL